MPSPPEPCACPSHSLRDPPQFVGQTGTVHRITDRGDVRVQFNHEIRWTFHPGALTKVPRGLGQASSGCLLSWRVARQGTGAPEAADLQGGMGPGGGAGARAGAGVGSTAGWRDMGLGAFSEVTLQLQPGQICEARVD